MTLGGKYLCSVVKNVWGVKHNKRTVDTCVTGVKRATKNVSMLIAIENKRKMIWYGKNDQRIRQGIKFV